MTRKEKIQLLKAIEQGKASIKDLEPPKHFVCIRTSENPDTYEMQGKSYTASEFAHFEKNVLRECDILVLLK